MSESPNVSDLLDQIWEHLKHTENNVSIRVSKNHLVNLTAALQDINDCLVNEDIAQASRSLSALAAIVYAAHVGVADELIEEMLVEEWRGLLDEREIVQHFQEPGPSK